MGFLTEKEILELNPSELLPHPTPIPTQIVSSDEFTPPPQSEKQKEVENRLLDMADTLGKRQGLDRRKFFQTAAGMAAGFVALNETFGTIFDASRAEASTPAMAQERAHSLKDQFIMDMHTHFLRDDTRLVNFVRSREAVGKAGWNPTLVDKPQTLDDLKFNNYFKEMYLDSDTKIALISSSPSEIARDWFLTNDMMIEARDKVNKEAGARRMFAHAIFTPGWDRWLEDLEHALQKKPESIKGYTVGDNTNKDEAKHPWLMDDEKTTYKAYELCVKYGIKNVCVHKGLFPRATAERWPHLLKYAMVDDVGKAAKDWPQLNFVIYHGGYRWAAGGRAEDGWDEFEKTGRVSWVSDLAEIPEKYGVTNVYADVGQLFAQSVAAVPQLGAALMGIMGKGLGYERVVWGTDAVWTGSPQWQIEALRRLEIPEDMQKKHGFKPLGAADGPIKNMIFGGTNAKLYNYDITKRTDIGPNKDRFARLKDEYEKAGPARSNLRYGYVNGPVDWSAFA
ncbi:amidohydrolase family protein [Leptospira sp. severe_002]|uniref:amidohydrolase family protein n=1 Tax=Leptospira sp. severe_002 TaxID=2838237 RepID=UPI001E3B79EE|nr:amidohydrolase family protein [Leptospira sp. severe_002]